MRTYELVLVARSSLSEKERTKLIDTVKGWLEDLKVSKEEVWGQKPLAYKIKREIAGYYYLLTLEGEKGVPSDFEKKVMGSDNILRHLLLRKK